MSYQQSTIGTTLRVRRVPRTRKPLPLPGATFLELGYPR